MESLSHERLGPGRVLRRAGILLAGLVVVLAAAAAAIGLWLRGYAPLRTTTANAAPGSGVGAVIEPAVGSGGKQVFFPAYRPGRTFSTSFTIRNGGRFAVTVEGLVPAQAGKPPWIGPVSLLTSDSVDGGGVSGRPFAPLRLAPGDSAVLVARFQPLCPSSGGRVPPVFSDSVELRYRYVRWFERTQRVSLPFAVTLRCVGGPLATP